MQTSAQKNMLIHSIPALFPSDYILKKMGDRTHTNIYSLQKKTLENKQKWKILISLSWINLFCADKNLIKRKSSSVKEASFIQVNWFNLCILCNPIKNKQIWNKNKYTFSWTSVMCILQIRNEIEKIFRLKFYLIFFNGRGHLKFVAMFVPYDFNIIINCLVWFSSDFYYLFL